MKQGTDAGIIIHTARKKVSSVWGERHKNWNVDMKEQGKGVAAEETGRNQEIGKKESERGAGGGNKLFAGFIIGDGKVWSVWKGWTRL